MPEQKVDDYDTLTARLAELNDELTDIDDRRAAIAGQIDQAKANRHATGEYADPDWFRRARGAMRHLGVERAEVERAIGTINRRLRELRGQRNRDLFRIAVMDVVDPDTYQRIADRHQELLDA